MADTPVTINRLRLSAPDAGSAKALGQGVATALQGSLPNAGVTGQFDKLRVTVSASEATDPAAISRAVVRALKGGAS